VNLSESHNCLSKQMHTERKIWLLFCDCVLKSDCTFRQFSYQKFWLTTYLLNSLWQSDFWTRSKISQTIVLWKLKPSVVIRSPFTLSLFVPLTHTFHSYGYRKCLALQVYYVTERKFWVRQPFVLVPVWISSLEESAKARLGLCEMVNNHLLLNASLKVTRQ